MKHRFNQSGPTASLLHVVYDVAGDYKQPDGVCKG